MARGRDPVEVRDDGDRDLYEVSSWEPRSALDGLSVWLHGALLSGARLFVVALALAILAVQVALGGFGALTNPVIGVFALLSVVPAFVIAAYVWYADVTTQEPLTLLVATFVLGVLFAGFAAVLNTLTSVTLAELGLTVGLVGFAAQVGTFYVVVGPVEEAVKLLAVRLYAFRSGEFDAVVDGAVYGAAAGLGFATIENLIYISGTVEGVADPLDLIATGSAVATVRALAGPGHVLYSAFAGYYLGLAKFNPDRAGAIVVKGLLVAAVVHATYNALSGVVPALVADAAGIPWFVAFFAFIVLYDGLFGLVLLRKVARYRRAYNDVHDDEDGGPPVERTEFDA
jgi:RsiW-degrading membrane proteinase PrsW (M82 family)